MRAFGIVPLLLLAACGGKPATSTAPALPPLHLVQRFPELQALAEQVPGPPAAGPQQELQQLWEALDADARLAGRAERDLREHQDASWLLVQHLGDPSEAHRIRAAWLLGQVGKPESMLPLLLRCKDEVRPDVRLWLADALWRLGNDSMLLDLVQSMDRAELANDAGRMAIERLQAAGVAPGEAPTYAFLQDELRKLYQHWRAEGTARRQPPLPPFDQAAFTPRIAALLRAVADFNLRLTDEARFILGSAGKLGLPLIRPSLAAEERYLRDLSLQIVILLGPVAAELQDAVLPLLGDPLMASYAVRALGEMRSKTALPYVRPLLDSKDLELRCAAAGALGLLGDRADIPRLTSLQNDDRQPLDLRVQAAFSLAVFETERPARAFLLRLRQDGKFHEPTLNRLLERLQQFDQQDHQPR
jgi:HEAT repeat protein